MTCAPVDLSEVAVEKSAERLERWYQMKGDIGHKWAVDQLRALRSALTEAKRVNDELAGEFAKARIDQHDLSAALTARDEALSSIRVFAQDCIENGHDRGALGNLYSIRDLCDSKGETK